jgi:putative transposase
VASTAVVIAVEVKAQTGKREVLGFDVGPSEDRAFWASFLRSLVARELSGDRLVTSNSHRSLNSTVEAVLEGVAWQRWRVHFMRNALSLVSKANQQMVEATILTIFAQPDTASAHQQSHSGRRQGSLPETSRPYGRGGGRCAHLRYFPSRTLAEGMVQQPA